MKRNSIMPNPFWKKFREISWDILCAIGDGLMWVGEAISELQPRTIGASVLSTAVLVSLLIALGHTLWFVIPVGFLFLLGTTWFAENYYRGNFSGNQHHTTNYNPPPTVDYTPPQPTSPPSPPPPPPQAPKPKNKAKDENIGRKIEW